MLTAVVEKLLNRGLPRSPRARQLCAQLAGKSLAVEVSNIARLRVISNGATLALAVAAADAAPADATLSGGPLGLLGLVAADSPRGPLQRGAVSMGGDTELAQQFRELLMLLRPDAEEELSMLVGDVPAHQLARLARHGAGFARRAFATGIANAAEYLGHERADLVPRAEGEQFLRGVDAVREDVERLEARLDILARRRAPR
jgi:ubiquinone biosynthesis accessory factor UbiJ